MSLNLLHIEDDLADAIIIKEALSKLSNPADIINITRVATMKDAMKELFSGEFNAILLDLNLPDIRGIDNVKCIRAEDPQIPIIVITSVDSQSWAEEVLEAGAQEYVVKGHCNGAILNRIIQSSICRKKIENKLYHQANYDNVTGLPNHMLFKDVVTNALNKAKRWERQEALLFLEIQNFKAIHRTHGQTIGEQFLINIGERLKATLRQGDFIARCRDDTFAIYLDKNNDEHIKERLRRVAEKLNTHLNAPLDIEHVNIHPSINTVMALYPEAGDTFTAIIENAEIAMQFLKMNKDTQFCFARNVSQNNIPSLKTTPASDQAQASA